MTRWGGQDRGGEEGGEDGVERAGTDDAGGRGMREEDEEDEAEEVGTEREGTTVGVDL